MLVPVWPEFLYVILGVIILFFMFVLKKRKSIDFDLPFFKARKKDKISISQVVLWGAFVCTVLCLLASFVAPYVLSIYPFEISLSSNVANSIYGLMSPFIAIAAAILTFMAFWVQYNANQNIYKENKKQQDERHFYEMLKIHRDNVDKIEFIYSSPIETLVEQNKESFVGYLNYQTKYSWIHSRGQKAIQYFLKEFLVIYKSIENDSNRFKKAYDVFFNGLSDSIFCSLQDKKLLAEKREKVYSEGLIESGKNVLPQCLIMEGRKTILNPYYRHLYLMVKSIVNSNLGDERENFLKTLRASLTAEEQAMLLFNWYYGKICKGGYGIKWEFEGVVDNRQCNQKYFTDWKMIHNLVEKDFNFVTEMDSFEKLAHLLDSKISTNDYAKIKELFDEYIPPQNH